MTRTNTLGEYLRAGRELVDPAAAGLLVTGVRRTPGLRREEVATLAGISAGYYLRLERGRDRNPSPPVLQALDRVPGLDPAATQHLLSLTGGGRAAGRAGLPPGQLLADPQPRVAADGAARPPADRAAGRRPRSR